MDALTNQLKNNLTTTLTNVLTASGVGANNTAVKNIVDTTALQLAQQTSFDVTTTANQQLDFIPKNVVGPKNPFDIVNSNLGPSNVTAGLGNVMNNKLSGPLTSQLVNTLTGQFSTLSPSLQTKLGVSNLTTGLGDVLGPTVNNNIQAALSSYSTGLFSKSTALPPIVPNISSFFTSTSDSNAALQTVNKQFSTGVANKYIQQASNFNVSSPENIEKLRVVDTGFTDPVAKYPISEYNEISETNKLAQGDVNGTVVQKKNKDRMIGAKLPGGESWDQPESPYKGEYPFNKVTQSESGHIIEIDDTPGSERIHVYHKSGTFVEIDVNGTVVKRAVGSSYEIIDKNGKIAISGKADISVNGECNIFVGNNANIEVEGDTNLTCHNDITAMAGGTFNLSAVEEFNITSTNVNIEAYNTMNMKSNVNLNMHVSTDFVMRSNTNMYMQTTTYYGNTTNTYNQTLLNTYEKHGASRFIESGLSTNIKSGTTNNLYSGSQTHIKAGSTVNVDGSQTYIQSGTAATASGSQDSKSSIIADFSKIGIMPGRKDIAAVVIEDPVAMNLADVFAIRVDEESASLQERLDHKDVIVTSGFTTFEEYDIAPIEVEVEEVRSIQNIILPGDESLKGQKELPGNFKLSPNFTFDQLTSTAGITKDFVESTDTISYGEIAFNLQQIALNVLEPAFNLYPNLIVVSGYRKPSTTVTGSLHPLGQAVDFQLRGFTKEELYEASKQLALVLHYDQFILHYCNYSSVPWIHVSFQGSNNRKQVLTFWNNERYTSGLANLK